MKYFLAKLTGKSDDHFFYELIKADTIEEAVKLAERSYGYGYDIEVGNPLER